MLRGTKSALAFAVVSAAVWAGSASGAAVPGTYYFHDCVGPAGTPGSFTAVKEYSSGVNGVSAALSFRLPDGSVFIVHAFDSTTTGKGIPAKQLTTTCIADFAAPVGSMPVSGFIAQG